MIYGPKSESSSFGWQTASRWRSACRLERPAYLSISRHACLTGWSCPTFREELDGNNPISDILTAVCSQSSCMLCCSGGRNG